MELTTKWSHIFTIDVIIKPYLSPKKKHPVKKVVCGVTKHFTQYKYNTVDWLENMAFFAFVFEISQDTSHSFVAPPFFAEHVKIAVAGGRRELFQKYKLKPR